MPTRQHGRGFRPAQAALKHLVKENLVDLVGALDLVLCGGALLPRNAVRPAYWNQNQTGTGTGAGTEPSWPARAMKGQVKGVWGAKPKSTNVNLANGIESDTRYPCLASPCKIVSNPRPRFGDVGTWIGSTCLSRWKQFPTPWLRIGNVGNWIGPAWCLVGSDPNYEIFQLATCGVENSLEPIQS